MTMDLRPYRTVATTLAGYLAVCGLGWLARDGRLPGDVVGALALAVAGLGTGQAVRSATEATAKARASGITTDHVVEAARRAVELARPVVTRGDGSA